MDADIEALIVFAAENGRTWKATLRNLWMNGGASPELQRLRNSASFGPTGLAKYRLPTCVHGKPVDPQSSTPPYSHRPGFCSICNTGHKVSTEV